MPAWLANMTVGQIVGMFVRHGATFVAVIAFMWGMGRPYAEDFVKTEVNKTVEQRLKTLEDSAAQIKKDVADQKVKQEVIQSDVNNIKTNQAEARDDIRAILGGLQRSGIVSPSR